MNPTGHNILMQVKLPWTVALEVVWQGIRIRMGRSLVTMMGVVLGVAFLMSVLSSNAIRQGMAEETEQRRETDRMVSFLESDTGPARSRTFGVLITGAPNSLERRLLNRLHREGVAALRVHIVSEPLDLPFPESTILISDPALLGEDSSGLMVIGPPTDLSALDGEALTRGMRQRVIAYTRDDTTLPALNNVIQIPLERQWRPEEVEQRKREAAQERVRNIWIISIALLVTIIGITNALLMSVTERFKEIGTMKCLGALSAFIRQIFFIESAMTGLAGSLIGGIVGFLVAALIYSFTFGFGLVFAAIPVAHMVGYYFLSVLGGVAMSVLAAIYPAAFASRMVPATALRSNI